MKKLFLPKGTSLMSLVYPKEEVPKALSSFLQSNLKIRQKRKGVFFEVILNDDLLLVLEDGKMSELDNCPCQIPVLSGLVADSVNKAHRELLNRFSPAGTNTRSVFEQSSQQPPTITEDVFTHPRFSAGKNSAGAEWGSIPPRPPIDDATDPGTERTSSASRRLPRHKNQHSTNYSKTAAYDSTSEDD